ncbi:MAG: hypothetical protein LBF55_01585, partial [Prevotellaceae bacterium]|nr:hypothetical protein [Prevotellaceae bacterium]
MSYPKKYFSLAVLGVAAALIFVRCAKDTPVSSQETELQLIKSTIRVHFLNAKPLAADSSLWLLEHVRSASGLDAKPQEESYVEFGYTGE